MFVQGGTKGMGLAAAECFAEEGARVAVLARGQAGIDAALPRLTELGAAEVIGLAADITQDVQIEAAFSQVQQRWGELNVLVNAAGSTVAGGFESLRDSDWLTSVDLVAMGMIRCVRAALPLLRLAEWARIVNVAAISPKRQTPGLVAYTAAKAMVTSVTKNLSQSLAPEAILVNTVSPGPFVTSEIGQILESEGVDPNDLHASMDYLAKRYGHPSQLQRMGAASEIGPVIAFLASRRNSYMTGANVNVDGGTDFC
ncbi:MAG TPA: SDR family oxidoreductase [Frankiaceae bacterium]|nr:SDR family oxidoreductase [Frankiaceae bacterium]